MNEIRRSLSERALLMTELRVWYGLMLLLVGSALMGVIISGYFGIVPGVVLVAYTIGAAIAWFMFMDQAQFGAPLMVFIGMLAPLTIPLGLVTAVVFVAETRGK